MGFTRLPKYSLTAPTEVLFNHHPFVSRHSLSNIEAYLVAKFLLVSSFNLFEEQEKWI
jgi:hypothetical protein